MGCCCSTSELSARERRFARYTDRKRGEESIVMKERAAWNVDEIIMVKGIANDEGEKQLLASIQESDRNSIKFFGGIDSASLSKEEFLTLLSTPVDYVRVVWYTGHGGCVPPLEELSLNSEMPRGLIALDNGRGQREFVNGHEIVEAITAGNSLSKQQRHESGTASGTDQQPRTILILDCCYAAAIGHAEGSTVSDVLGQILVCDRNGQFENNVKQAKDSLWKAITSSPADDKTSRDNIAYIRRKQYTMMRNVLWTLGLDRLGIIFKDHVVPLSVGSLYDKEGLSAMFGDISGKGEPAICKMVSEELYTPLK